MHILHFPTWTEKELYPEFFEEDEESGRLNGIFDILMEECRKMGIFDGEMNWQE